MVKVSCVERCPYFRCKFTVYLGHCKVSVIQRCHYFRVASQASPLLLRAKVVRGIAILVN